MVILVHWTIWIINLKNKCIRFMADLLPKERRFLSQLIVDPDTDPLHVNTSKKKEKKKIQTWVKDNYYHRSDSLSLYNVMLWNQYSRSRRTKIYWRTRSLVRSTKKIKGNQLEVSSSEEASPMEADSTRASQNIAPENTHGNHIHGNPIHGKSSSTRMQ